MRYKAGSPRTLYEANGARLSMLLKAIVTFFFHFKQVRIST